MKTTRRITARGLFGLIAVSLMASIALSGCRATTGAGNTPSAAGAARTATVERGTLQVRVSGTGEIAPKAYASLVFSSQGVVQSVTAQVGDRVKRGDVLVELDLASMESSILQAQADVIDAQKALDDLTEPPTALELAQAEQAVLDAQQAVEDAERHLSGVKYPDVADYQQAYDDALAGLENAQANQTLTDLGAETSAVQRAQDAVDQARDRLGQAQSADAGCGGCQTDNVRRAQDDYNGALNALTSAQLQLQMAQTSNQQAIRDAQEAARDAQNNLNAAMAGPDPEDVAQAEAKLATAQAQYDKAKEDLAELKNGPDPDDVAAAQARLAAAQARANQYRLFAPMDGTVLAIKYAPGDTVTPGALAAVVADLSQLHIDTTVDELDIAQVMAGQPVAITLDALPGVQLAGMIARIDLDPDRTQTTIEYPVRVTLDATEQPVRLGMTAALEILVAQKDNVLLVPNWALKVDREKGGTYVTVQRGGATEATAVELGLRNETFSEVLSGLAEGDVVVAVISTPEPPGGGPFGGG